MEGAKYDQAATDLLGAPGQIVDHRLQQRAEIGDLLAVDVLELIKGHDIAIRRQATDQLRKFAETGYPGVEAEIAEFSAVFFSVPLRAAQLAHGNSIDPSTPNRQAEPGNSAEAMALFGQWVFGESGWFPDLPV